MYIKALSALSLTAPLLSRCWILMFQKSMLYFQLYIADIKNKMDNFQEVTLMPTRRGSKRLAHELAAHASKYGDLVMFADVPPDLKKLFLKECSMSDVPP